MNAVFATATHAARELAAGDLPRLQAFFEANPGYFLAVSGAPPRPTEARDEFDEPPPAHLPHGRRWCLGFLDAADDLQGFAIVVRDLGAAGVWHIALYLWATRLHGSGLAAGMHDALAQWALAAGADWLRLGVVVGNGRAERFWDKLGYREVRRRHGVPAGCRVNSVRVLVRPLRGQPLAAYLELMPRDRPDSALP
ncbi:MAG: GNAT family N-acetyltransferase [Burkholderiaceae bacterium]|nr:GNAT family N-acetyltransferase [Burkholderiaceae bacterium]